MKPVRGDVNWPKSRDPRAKVQAEAPKHRASKDTKRWCLGRPGKRHACAWRFVFSSYYQPRPGEQPHVLQLRCTHPPCNKVLVESYRATHYWPSHELSQHDADARAPRFYGPGLPPKHGWYVRANVPAYVDVLGEP